MIKMSLHILAKIFIYIFLLYIRWYLYVFGQRPIILYGSAIMATIIMVVDLMLSHKDILKMCPWGVLVNLVMCFYSLMFGFWVAKDLNVLISAVKTYVAFSMVCVVICYISREEDGIDWLIDAIIAVCIIQSIYILTHGYYKRGYGYILGPDNNPNTLGIEMDLGLFCLAYKSRKNLKFVMGYILFASLFLYVVVGCGSRKSLLAGGIMCVLWLFPLFLKIWNRGNMISRIFLILAVAAMIYGIYIYYNNVYINSDSYSRMQNIDDISEGSSNGYRVKLYKLAFEYFEGHPFFGIGLQQYSVWSPTQGYSHSTYAEALASWGFVGCLIYFISLFSLGIAALRKSFSRVDTYVPRIIFGLWAMEVFLGVGQIWFYGIDHMIAWTIIALCINEQKDTTQYMGRTCKYVKA